MVATAPRKRSHFYSTFITFVALVELALLIAAFMWFRNATPCVDAATASASHLLARVPIAGGMLAGGLPTGGGNDTSGNGTSQAQPPAAAPPAASSAGDSAANAAGAGSGAPASGDLNAVPDPNCVGHQAAALLNSDQVKAQPTCGALKAPQALKDAAATVKHL